jgi:hypothetical protein
MSTTYHLSSAQELNADILEAIKATFKSKPITITVEEDIDHYVLTTEMKTVLDDRLKEDEGTYLTGEDAIEKLHKKYGL